MSEDHQGATVEWSPLAEIGTENEPEEDEDSVYEWSLIIHGMNEIRCRSLRDLIHILRQGSIQETLTKYPMTVMRVPRLRTVDSDER